MAKTYHVITQGISDPTKPFPHNLVGREIADDAGNLNRVELIFDKPALGCDQMHACAVYARLDAHRGQTIFYGVLGELMAHVVVYTAQPPVITAMPDGIENALHMMVSCGSNRPCGEDPLTWPAVIADIAYLKEQAGACNGPTLCQINKYVSSSSEQRFDN